MKGLANLPPDTRAEAATTLRSVTAALAALRPEPAIELRRSAALLLEICCQLRSIGEHLTEGRDLVLKQVEEAERKLLDLRFTSQEH